MRILTVVETQFAARNVLQSLEEIGLTNGELVLNENDAMDRLEKESFDLILIDAEWLQPGIDPLVLVRRVRATPKNQATPVLICSSRGTVDDIQRAREAGASGYVLKPYTPGVLKEHIERLAVEA